jgi:hypothetical protein
MPLREILTRRETLELTDTQVGASATFYRAVVEPGIVMRYIVNR